MGASSPKNEDQNQGLPWCSFSGLNDDPRRHWSLFGCGGSGVLFGLQNVPGLATSLGGVLEIDRTVSARVEAPPDRCLAVLRDVAGYPRWSRLVGKVDVVDNDRVRVRADVLGLPVLMNCVLEADEGSATLRRLPNDPDDDEQFTAAWTVREAPGGADVGLRVRAAMNAPGPARLIRGRVERKLADELLADLAAAV
jgi:hypothetical protein